MKQPNILLIMTDEMRGDCVGVRHPDVKTPYLDTLIAREPIGIADHERIEGILGV